MVCLQSIYGKAVTLGSPVSPPLEFQRSMFAITACGQVVTLGSPVSPPMEFHVCNHCLCTSCHPGVSSVSTPGVPAWYVCNHCLWESCQCGVSSVSAYGVSAFLFITCGKLPPWRLQCPNPSISSVVCLQSLLVGQLSSWGLQRLRPCREFQRGTLAISLVNNLSPRNFQ